MELFTIAIDKIHEVKEGRRVVFVTIDTSFYSGKEYGVKYAFLKSRWDRIKAQKAYWENEIMNQEDGEHLEGLPEAEWCKRFERNLKHVPDEELVAEVNRRAAAGLWQSIEFKVEAVVRPKK